MEPKEIHRPLLQVLANDEGSVVGVMLRRPSAEKNSPSDVYMEAGEGQTVHEVELPAELLGKELGPAAFDDYEIDKAGAKPMLKRRGAKA